MTPARMLAASIVLGFLTHIAACSRSNGGDGRNSVATSQSNDADDTRKTQTDPAMTEGTDREKSALDRATLEGRGIRKPWTKSGESWRAQGGEYYVLDVGEFALSHGKRTARKGVILRPSLSVAFGEFDNYVGENVVVDGLFVPDVEYREYNGNDPNRISQILVAPGPDGKGKRAAPVGGGFKVLKITIAD